MRTNNSGSVLVPAAFRLVPRLAGLARMLGLPPDGRAPLVFTMGNHDTLAELVKRYGHTEAGYADSPSRRATLPGAFHLMRYPVTNALFAEFVRSQGAEGRPYVTTAEERGAAWVRSGAGWGRIPGACWSRPGDGESNTDGRGSAPVTCVSWHDAVAFTHWLTDREVEAGTLGEGMVYRLPTEAEWEFACRAGTGPVAFWWGETLDDEHAVHRAGRFPQRGGPEPVEPDPRPGQGRTNPWGLSDMLGNVWEWCADAYVQDDPGDRVLRGGSWGSSSAAGRLLSCFRGHMPGDEVGDRNGFRVVYGRSIA